MGIHCQFPVMDNQFFAVPVGFTVYTEFYGEVFIITASL